MLGLGTVQSPDIARPDLRTFVILRPCGKRRAGKRSKVMYSPTLPLHQLHMCISTHLDVRQCCQNLPATGKYDIYQCSLRFLKYVQIGLDNSDVKKR